MTENPRRTRLNRTSTGQVARFARGEDLTAYTRSLIEASQDPSVNVFPPNKAICESFGISQNTLLRNWQGAELVDDVRAARRRVVVHRTEQNYGMVLGEIEDGTRTDHPSLATFSEEFRGDKTAITGALREASLLVDFKQRWADQEREQLSERVAQREQEAQQRQAAREREKKVRAEKKQTQDNRVESRVVTELLTLATGLTENLSTDIHIGANLGISRGEVAISLKRTGIDDVVRDIRENLTQKQKIIVALEQALTRAREDPRVGIPPYGEIAEAVGADIMTVASAAKAGGLRVQLREARESAKTKEFLPSQETAWVLGALIGSGSIARIDDKPYTISFTSRNPYVMDTFEKSAERVLETKGIKATREDKGARQINFHTVSYATALGDFKGAERASTINTNHKWVFDETFIDSFASGVFDARGTLVLTDTKRYLNFYTDSMLMAQFYRLVLIRLGIHRSKFKRDSGRIDRTRGIMVGRLDELKTFASHVKSVDPSEQAKLDAIKTLERKKQSRVKLSDQQVLDAWVDATAFLGRRPTSTDIYRLRSEGRTPLAVSIIARLFGTDPGESSGSFSRGADRIEDIVGISAENNQVYP